MFKPGDMIRMKEHTFYGFKPVVPLFTLDKYKNHVRNLGVGETCLVIRNAGDFHVIVLCHDGVFNVSTMDLKVMS